MNSFQEVKSQITAREAAEYYGICVGRNGMACCPFHEDHTPSMKLDARFHCFGCGADGDAIDFVSRLFSLDCKAAAEKIARDFRIQYEQPAFKYPVRHQCRSDARSYTDAETRCIRVLSEYMRLLRKWRKAYAPEAGQKWEKPFVEALLKQADAEYHLDCLLNGNIIERATWIARYGKDVVKLEGRLSELAARFEGGGDADGRVDAASEDGGGNQKQSPSDQKGYSSEQH